MADAIPVDLTRWNRAGLTRFQYIDGNAATTLETLRAALAEKIPAWDAVQAAVPAGETASEKAERLEAQYADVRDDMLWALLRTFARANQVLTGHMNAYANESYLGTATQWDNVRKLVEMLDYHPSPPASAFTTLALDAKAGQSGTLEKGFQIKYAPAKADPVVFETLEDLQMDPALNTLRPAGWDRNPAALGGHTLLLAEKIQDLKTGEPLVLEDERSGVLKAYLIQGLASEGETTKVTVSPTISNEFISGYTRVHVLPKDKLAPHGPTSTGATLRRSLQLSGSSSNLQPGEVVILTTPGKKPRYRRLRYVEATRLVFTTDLGDVDLGNAAVSRPVAVPVSQHGRRSIDGSHVINVVYAAGDWSRLTGQWMADQRFAGGQKLLPVYEVTSAKYVPAGMADSAALQPDDKPGYTALTLRWSAADDEVPLAGDFSLNNPQSLLAPPVSPGPWKADVFLEKNGGHLPSTLVTAQAKKAAAGDLAVVVEGNQMAWARLQSAGADLEKGESRLRAEGDWQDRGGGPLYLSRTSVYAHFKSVARLLDWDKNATPISGVVVPVDAIPAALAKNRAVLIQGDASAIKTKVEALDPSAIPPQVILADPLPAGSTYGGVRLRANAVSAGHGEARSERVLGSGDATKSNPAYSLAVAGIAFVADSTQPSGVAAAMDVKVDGRIWEQVGNLKDSGPADAHYTVRMTEDGFLTVAFGDGVNGRRLPTGLNNLRVKFRQGTGIAGNLPAGSLLKPVKPHRLVDSVEQPLAAGGGADMEDAATLKQSAPATVLTLERAVSLADFGLLMRSNSSVWQARAFALPTGLGQRENIEVVVIPAGGGALGSDLRIALEAYALAAAMPGVQVKVSLYEKVIVSVTIAIRVKSAEFDPEAVKAEVEAKLKDAFSLKNRGLGQPLYRSEVYQVVEAVSGVENSDCSIGFNPVGQAFTVMPVSVTGADGMIRVLRAGDRQCIHLDPDNPGVEVTPQEFSL